MLVAGVTQPTYGDPPDTGNVTGCGRPRDQPRSTLRIAAHPIKQHVVIVLDTYVDGRGLS